jgi:hypothetical protein
MVALEEGRVGDLAAHGLGSCGAADDGYNVGPSEDFDDDDVVRKPWCLPVVLLFSPSRPATAAAG